MTKAEAIVSGVLSHQSITVALVLAWAALLCPPMSPTVALADPIDLSQIGGGLTSELPGRFALQLPGPSVQGGDRRQLFLDGFPVFHRAVSRREGLGPRFINRSCAGCHVENGRGPIGFNRSALGESTMVVKVALKRTGADGLQPDVPGLGPQLLDQDTSGKKRHDLSLRWRTIRGQYPDGTAYKLRRPVLNFSVRRVNRRRIAASLRMSPPIIGLGLLESIPQSTLESWSDPEDTDGNGISGRMNIVPDLRTGSSAAGRFGFKAAQPNVEQQSLAALFFDMGISNSLFGDRQRSPEFPENEFLLPLLFYQRLAGVPLPREISNPQHQEGFTLFQSIGCADCHRFGVRTGVNADPELSDQVIHPFSDLLLHDMGRGLADPRREFGAAGREWRTTPLWGLGFSRTVSKVRVAYLHDGRARTIEEAILWHGGEAGPSQNRFKELAVAQREAVLAFLNSL